MDEPVSDPPRRHPDDDLKPIDRYGISIFFIVVAAAFCVGSTWLLVLTFAHSKVSVLETVRQIGVWECAYFMFYAFAGFFAALFHVLYLVTRRPSQGNAGILGIFVALVLTGLIAGAFQLLLYPPVFPWEQR